MPMLEAIDVEVAGIPEVLVMDEPPTLT